MTTTVTITRHYSGFQNVTDYFSVGNHEHEGNASTFDYTLPDGYVVHEFGFIIDPAGYQCEIIAHNSGAPQLVSRAGKITAQPVLTRVTS